MRGGSELVSVIMPMFNAERWIEEAIESVLRQSWKQLELIIVDDGSTDASASIANRFVGSRVALLRQPNQGAGMARNAALAVAQGDYIQYLDADDLLGRRKIELQVEALREAPEHVATCTWGRFVQGTAHARLEPTALWSDFAPVDFLVEAYGSNQFMPNHAWLTPRSVAERAGRWSPMRARNDDAEYFAKVVLASSGVSFVQDAHAYYRSGHAGLSAARDPEAIAGYLWTLEQIADHLLAVEDSRRTHAALAVAFDHFVSEVDAVAPDLAMRAEQHLRRLVGSRFEPPRARTPMRILSWLLGRGGARALRRLYRERVERFSTM